MGQIMKSPKSATTVCTLSYGHNSQSLLMKLCTVVRNLKSKIGVKICPLLPYFTPNRHPYNAVLMATLKHHTNEPVDRLWRLLAHTTLLGGHCTCSIETRSSAIAGRPCDAKACQDSWNGRGNDNLGWMTFKCTSRSSKVAPIES